MDCIFDNPITFQREVWVDGKKTCWISAQLIDQRDTRWRDRLPRGPEIERLWVESFSPRKCDGDPAAMEALATNSTAKPTGGTR
jgi:hypothetical protein